MGTTPADLPPRRVVVHGWTGAHTVKRLGPSDPDPSQPELDAIADAYTARNGGVRPDVRVLAAMPDRIRTGVGGASGIPGTPAAVMFPPRRTW